ncbi:hypothetical protein MJI37_32685, partial [Salmonella enterica subsp. enterica serovar Cerro]|nr:hypothetical protein [Salmonella enterica subsp. enterica serovar Cerro]
PKMTRDVQTLKAKGDALNRADITIADAVNRVLHLPTVAEKTFTLFSASFCMMAILSFLVCDS